MRTLNLGILAHVDAGKTTLSERLLFTTGAIDRVGSVDAGTTQTDSLELERERGITIRSAVASFLVGDLAVNLVDTPGHPDFIAEVERVLGVLDGAVLVVSAVEGVQPQTPLLFRALQRLHVPTLIFVNKIDRAGPTRMAWSPRWRGGSPRRWSRWAGSPTRAAAQPLSCRMTAMTWPTEPPGRNPRRARRGDPAGIRRRRARAHVRAPPGAARRADPGLPGTPRVLRLGRDGHRHRSAPCRSRCAPQRPRRRSRRGRLGPRVQDRARVIGRAGSVRAPVRRHPPTTTARAGRRRRGREADLDQGVRAGRSSAPGDAGRRRDGGRPRPRGRSRRRRRWPAASGRGGDHALPAPGARGGRRSRPPGAGGQPAGRPFAARRAGPADQRPAGRSPARDLGLALRRGAEGGHRRDAGARLRHRRRLPRDDDRVHRAAGQGRGGRRGHPGEDSHQHHRAQLAGEREPVHGHPGATGRAHGARVGYRVPRRRRAEAHPPVPVPDARDVLLPDGGERPRRAGRGADGLAGHRLPRDHDRLRLHVANHVGRRLPAAHAAGAGRGARSGGDVGLRAVGGPIARDAVVDRAGGARRRSAGSADGSVGSTRPTASRGPRPRCPSHVSGCCTTSCPGCRWGRGSWSHVPTATSRSGRTRRARERSGPSPLERDAWLAWLARRG